MSAKVDVPSKVRFRAATVQAACASISTHVNSISILAGQLPQEQAKTINEAIDIVSATIMPELETPTTSAFVWDKLPGEVKNKIYKLLLVSDKPIDPLLRSGSRRKHYVQGQVLRLNKSIYKEALPVLLGDNIFILNSDLGKYLGYSTTEPLKPLSHGVGTSPPDRGAMVQKLAITSNRMTGLQKTNLNRLNGVRELFFVPPCMNSQRLNQIDAQDWETICATNHRSFATEDLLNFVRLRPSLVVYLIGFQNFTDSKEASTDHTMSRAKADG